MFAVEVRTVDSGKRGYISGIFKDGSSALAYLEEIPEELRSLQVMHWIPLDYPIYAIERFDFGGRCYSLELVDYDGLQKAMASIERNRELESLFEKGDHSYMLITYFEKDWCPPEELWGADNMGCLSHESVDGEFLDELEKHGEVDFGIKISLPT